MCANFGNRLGAGYLAPGMDESCNLGLLKTRLPKNEDCSPVFVSAGSNNSLSQSLGEPAAPDDRRELAIPHPEGHQRRLSLLCEVRLGS